MRSAVALLLITALAAPAFARTPVRARKAMVVAEEPLAVDAGVRVLKAGGNAVDAAVTVALALAVTYPVAGNIGGGGFLLARMAGGRTAFFDFRERAPRSASRDMYLDASGNLTRDSIDGWRAPGVPGTVRGLELAHRKLGRKPWAQVVRPAVMLASRGFEVSYELAHSLNDAQQTLGQYPESNRIFLRGGRGWQPGDRIIQRDLGRTLSRIARYGSRGFYEGETARLIAAAMRKHGGLITREDLKSYQAVEREPLTGSYRGYSILTAPPPSSGGIGILQMLGVLEGTDYASAGWGSASHIHTVVETMRRYYADRSEYLGDPDYFKVPVRALLHPKYIEQLRKSIRPGRASTSDEVRPGSLMRTESTETTHISIVDAQGNAVSMTYTLNGGYGSGVTPEGTGVLLNNEMDDFAAQPGSPNMFGLVQGEANAIQPGKRPLSSMTPTILSRDGKLFMVVGGPGGGRIITSVLQTIANAVDFGMNVRDAVDSPRFHHQWRPDAITMEQGFSPDTIRILEQMGHRVQMTPSLAHILSIVVQEDGWLSGFADGRSYGKAAGY